ncbi:hypothetical protein [uncultured Campylobacter sp.]|uniref:hypothetical protein n=1 Tax=uncultured Campylobacter sp. TaxID=218934 RepID=UPI002621758E|nr:hypothetical protein [uncultured Campylobacter sp.]
MGLFSSEKKAEKAQIPSTFAGRVDKFWAEFSGMVDEIKADLAAEEFEKAMQKTDEKLRICLAEPYFMTGLAGERLDLVLTPEGMRHRLFWLSFIKNAMPRQLESKMLCTLGKPRAPRGIGGIEMYDTHVNAEESMIYAQFNESDVDIKIYNENLAALLAQDEGKAYNLSFILLDNMIGETAIINTLGELEVLAGPEEKGVPLSEFADLIDEKFGERASREPLKNFFSYEMQPRGSEVREDVVVGTTCLRNLIGEYLGGKRDIYNEAFELGIKFCFLSVGNGGDMQAGFDLRNKIEDEELESCGSFLEIIGGATGQKHTYIDLICYDEEKLKEKVQQLCKKYGANIQIHDFKR